LQSNFREGAFHAREGGPRQVTQSMPLLPASPANIARAAERLRAGEVVAFPTETVYGLGADATNGEAVAKIFAAKTRPKINPLITHVPDAGTAHRHAIFSPVAEKLAAAFWPGPLTLVLPRKAESPVADLVTAGLETIALRVPRHPVAQALLRACNVPLAAPSANRSGEPSPTDAAHVAESLGDEIMVLDGGAAIMGLESTIIGFDGSTPVLLRLGAIARQEIEAITGPLADAELDPARPRAPGRMFRHYAPKKPVALNITAPLKTDAFLSFGPAPSGAHIVLPLSAAGRLEEAASNLFRLLRLADKSDAARIAVAPIPSHGLGEAINDRLRRAANVT